MLEKFLKGMSSVVRLPSKGFFNLNIMKAYSDGENERDLRPRLLTI